MRNTGFEFSLGAVSYTHLVGISCNFSVDTLEADPVNDDFLKLPYPVTTTSSSTSASDFKVILTVCFIATSCVAIPIKETTKVFAELISYLIY